MKIGIFQPYFFPYIGYFQLIHAVDRFILYPEIQYICQGWINRNRIVQKNGCIQYILVPVHSGSHLCIKDVHIDNTSLRWRQRLIKSIRNFYGKAAYFKEIYPLLEEVLTQQDYLTISDLNVATIRSVANFLEMETEIVCANTERYQGLEEKLVRLQTNGYDELPQYAEKQVSRMLVRIFEICRMEGADTFINSIGGTALYKNDVFAHHGVNLNFLQTHDIQYKQQCEEFIPNLSIIDVLMHNGKEKTKELLTHYTLI